MINKYRNYLLSIMILCTAFQSTVYAQQQDSLERNWEITLGLGTDITQLLQINPKVGAGENRFGIGWVVNATANKKRDRFAWDNNAIWSFSIQKQGGGFLNNTGEKIPFQKSIDELRVGSKVGYKFRKRSKFYYAADFSFLSQVVHTYAGNYLVDINEPDANNTPVSRFLSPGQITFSLGVDYKPNNQVSLFLSPFGYKSIMVLDRQIADDIVRNKNGEITGSVHGNPITTDDSKMNLLAYQRVRNEMGSLLRATYKAKFLKEKIALKSGLVMYANYLRDVGKIDYEWTNEINFVVLNGLHISFFTTLFYDYDIYSYKTNYDLPNGVEPIPRRDLVSFSEQFVVKYNVVF
jgi:hypothetical protein